jgi:hypothetical protein
MTTSRIGAVAIALCTAFAFIGGVLNAALSERANQSGTIAFSKRMADGKEWTTADVAVPSGCKMPCVFMRKEFRQLVLATPAVWRWRAKQQEEGRHVAWELPMGAQFTLSAGRASRFAH